MGWTKEYRNHGLRGEKLQSVHHVGDRCVDVPIEYEYEYRSVGLSTSTMGIRQPASQNPWVHRAAANDIDFRTRATRGSACNPLLCDLLDLLGGKCSKQWLAIVGILFIPIDDSVGQIHIKKGLVVCIFIKRFAILAEQL